MLSIPNMVLVGGNSRNSGKTTMACNIISKLSSAHETVGLKVTAIRPGEDQFHGDHGVEESAEFSVYEELNASSHKDTSKMLRAGAHHVFYIRVNEKFIQKALLHFLSTYINKQIIVCESRSLRRFINPGLFLMMMRLPEEGKTKNDLDTFLSQADEVFYFDENQHVKNQYLSKLHFANGKFVVL
jgi:hypothetical protein